MCYRTATAKEVVLKDFLGNGYTFKDYESSYHLNGFAHPLLPSATNEEPNLIQPLQWGLIPSWIKDNTVAKEIAIKTLNAKSETIFTTPSYRDSIMKKRFLILV